jgi:hypothetical protein
MNAERKNSASTVKPRPYSERSVRSLLSIKAKLEQQGELVPVDLLAALGAKGVVT